MHFWQSYSFMVCFAKIVRHDHAVQDDLRGVAAFNCWLNADQSLIRQTRRIEISLNFHIFKFEFNSRFQLQRIRLCLKNVSHD